MGRRPFPVLQPGEALKMEFQRSGSARKQALDSDPSHFRGTELRLRPGQEGLL